MSLLHLLQIMDGLLTPKLHWAWLVSGRNVSGILLCCQFVGFYPVFADG